MSERANPEHTSHVERALDAGITAVGAMSLVPGAAVAAVGLAAFGKAGLIFQSWRESKAAEAEEKLYELVIWQAVVALEQGNESTARGAVEAYANNPHFRARVHATVSRMREGTPSTDAIGPLALLIAAYEGHSPPTDALFRNAASFLSDCAPADIAACREFLVPLAEKFKKPRFVFNVKLMSGGDAARMSWRGPTAPGQPVVPHVDFANPRVVNVFALMLATSLLTPDAASGGLNDTYDGESCRMDLRTIALLNKVFGIDHPLAREFH